MPEHHLNAGLQRTNFDKFKSENSLKNVCNLNTGRLCTNLPYMDRLHMLLTSCLVLTLSLSSLSSLFRVLRSYLSAFRIKPPNAFMH